MSPHSLVGHDASAVKGRNLDRSALRRAWGFAGPYQRDIALFLLAIIGDALVALVPPLLCCPSKNWSPVDWSGKRGLRSL